MSADRETVRIPANPVDAAVRCWERECELRWRLAAAVAATNAARRDLTDAQQEELAERLAGTR